MMPCKTCRHFTVIGGRWLGNCGLHQSLVDPDSDRPCFEKKILVSTKTPISLLKEKPTNSPPPITEELTWTCIYCGSPGCVITTSNDFRQPIVSCKVCNVMFPINSAGRPLYPAALSCPGCGNSTVIAATYIIGTRPSFVCSMCLFKWAG